MDRKPIIIFEDDHILVLNKPPGFVVNRAETQKEETLEQWLSDEKKIRIERSGIVHRLDKDTSGVLVVAKTLAAMHHLQAQFANRKTQKQYIALAHGNFSQDEGTIKESLGRNPKNRTKFTVIENGRPSETSFRVTGWFLLAQEKIKELLPHDNKNQQRYYQQQAQNYTLLRLEPKTGRTHQIRVHLLTLRHPIVSDRVYTSRRLLRLDLLWCSRQFLHAEKLSFTHPVTGERMTFTSELPKDLREAIEVLQPKERIV